MKSNGLRNVLVIRRREIIPFVDFLVIKVANTFLDDMVINGMPSSSSELRTDSCYIFCYKIS